MPIDTTVILGQATNYLAYMLISAAMLLIFMRIYTWITPHDEFALIRSGNIAAAWALGGSALGFSLTLASSIQHSASIAAFVVWGILAFFIQIITYFIATRLFGNVSQAIIADNRGVGILMCAISLSVGTINAACLS